MAESKKTGKTLPKGMGKTAAKAVAKTAPKSKNSKQSETKKIVPKQKRQAAEAGMTQYNKKVKTLVKSSDVKASDDVVVAKNKSGGKKPFSKGAYGPTGPKVPVKPKGGRGMGGAMLGGGSRGPVIK